MIRFDTIAGPAHWASYFLTGDASSLKPGEQYIADMWCRNNGVRIVGIDGDIWWTDCAYQFVPELGWSNCNMVDYVCAMNVH